MVVASRTTNPLLLGLLIAICCVTVVLRRGTAPWAMAFHLYVYLAVFIVALRIVFRIVFSANGSTVILHLPVIVLPGVLGSVRLLGPVSAEALMATGQAGLQLAAMVIAVGAANALANPKRLLAAVPGALYEWGTVVVIAISVFPQLAESVVQVRRARRLRGQPGKGTHLIRQVAMPVLANGLDRALLLAGAMDSRGYGRSAAATVAARRLTSSFLIISTLAFFVGSYGLLNTGRVTAWMGAPMVIGGLIVGFAGLRLSGRRVTRTRYRPDRMAGAEWLTLGTGAVAAVGIVVAAAAQPQIVNPAPQPLAWPPVSALAFLVVPILLAPAFLTPPPDDVLPPVPAADPHPSPDAPGRTAESLRPHASRPHPSRLAMGVAA